MRLGICSRSKDVVEPKIKPQWYVKCSGMGNQALDAAIDSENRKLEIIPRQYTAEWLKYLLLVFAPCWSLVVSILNITLISPKYWWIYWKNQLGEQRFSP